MFATLLQSVRNLGKMIKAWIRFFIYFACIIVGIGGLGVWISFAQYKLGRAGATLGALQNNLATFVIAISVTAFADYLIVKNTKDDRTARLFLFVLTLVSLASASCIFVIGNATFEKACVWTGAVVAALIWIIVNWGHPNLVDTDAVSTLGGPVRT